MAFLRLSQQATGFELLDPLLADRYLTALLDWEPGLAALLDRGAVLNQMTPADLAIVDLVIEAWYTGTVPTARGTEVLTFQGALGCACLPRSTPVTFCRQ